MVIINMKNSTLYFLLWIFTRIGTSMQCRANLLNEPNNESMINQLLKWCIWLSVYIRKLVKQDLDLKEKENNDFLSSSSKCRNIHYHEFLTEFFLFYNFLASSSTFYFLLA